jgi:hypothetical protein
MPKVLDVIASVAVGGALAGTVLYASSGAGQPSAEQATLVERREGLRRDRALLDAVTEPEQLFRRVDPETTERLLDALDGLALLLQEAQKSGTPLLMAKALAQKRKGSAALEALLSASRRRFPSRASDAAEDAEALRKAMTDYVHNIQQSASLSLLEASLEAS